MQIQVEKLVFGGQGLGRLPNGQVCLVWNALPGETVEVDIISKKKNLIEAVATHIIEPSPYRVQPIDPHYLSSSPWQMISWEKENEWKKEMAVETYNKIGNLILTKEDLQIVSDEQQYGYRNKMEFSFHESVGTNNTKISLAFFERGKKVKIAASGSALCHPVINETAQYVLTWINEQQIPIRSLKSLIVRSTQKGEAIAALFIKDKLEFSHFPALTGHLKGFHLYYSTHKSPASVPTELMHSEGQDYLTEDILGTKHSFGLLGFFQVNVPIFVKALKDIAAFLDPKVPLVDYYAGVGAIGLPLSQARTSTILVESNEEAALFAQKNIEANNLSGCEVHCTVAENMTDWISGEKMIIVDPPRAGLHEKVVRALLTKRPRRIIYLSCNISTQARDMRMLSENYSLSFLRLYNFFPRTPHIEGLAVLDRIA